jgi:hypothetical protein
MPTPAPWPSTLRTRMRCSGWGSLTGCATSRRGEGPETSRPRSMPGAAPWSSTRTGTSGGVASSNMARGCLDRRGRGMDDLLSSARGATGRPARVGRGPAPGLRGQGSFDGRGKDPPRGLRLVQHVRGRGRTVSLPPSGPYGRAGRCEMRAALEHDSPRRPILLDGLLTSPGPVVRAIRQAGPSRGGTIPQVARTTLGPGQARLTTGPSLA